MKYCSKCGNPMEDDMLFCQKCGAKFVEAPVNIPVEVSDTSETSKSEWNNGTFLNMKAERVKKTSNKPRKGMRIAANVFIIFAVIYLLMALSVDITMISATALFGIIGLMFLVLSKYPKSSTYVLGKLKKSYFVIICLVLSFVLPVVLLSIMLPEGNVNNSGSSEEMTSNLISEEQTDNSSESTEIELTREEKKFVEAFGCNAEQAKQMYSIFEEIGLTLSNADKVSRREDLDNWDDDGSVAYEIADVARVDGEKQSAFLYLVNDFEVSDIRFLSCYLYEDGAFVQTAEEAASVGWAAGFFENECPISVSATITTDLIGTPVVEAKITNNSDKNIAAVKILAHPLDVYSAPIKNYGYGEEYTSLNSDESISTGSSKTVSWALYGYDTTKTTELWIYSVYFEDGTQWGAYDGLSVEIMQKYGVYLTAE